MAGFLSWLRKGADIAKDGTKLDQATGALEQACQSLAQSENPTPEQRAAVNDAYKKWEKALADAGGDVVKGVPIPFADKALSELIQNMQQSPAVQQPRMKQAAEMLEAAGLGEKARYEKGLCRAAGDKFKQSKNAPPPRRDPLAIDLDGDGIETVAATEGIHFDHDGNGIKTASGWVRGDDGLLVLDKDGNGLIDNGAELFGVDTVLANGQKATDGFRALAELDSNSDGVIDASDAAFQNLKVWRDIDQDGVSQSDELFTLTELGITSFNLTKTVASQNLGNGNQVLATGSYTRSDGSTASIVNLDLAENRFDSEFVESISLSPEVQALPSMSGMGLVRNLSEAAMLSPAVLASLTQYAATTTVYEQKALLDQLVTAWAATGASPSQSVQYEFAGIQHYVNNDPLAGETDAYKAMLGKLHTLEIFNAESFAASGVTNLTLRADQVALINQGYDALKAGVFDSLISQTLLKPYFDAVSVVDDGSTARLDYSGVLTLLDQRINADPSVGMAEMVELYRQAGGFFVESGWNIVEYFGRAISAHPIDGNLTALLTSSGIKVGGAGNDSLATSATLTTVFGGDGSDSISGGSENATVYGGDGNDTITDGDGSDTIEGGAGDDVITDQGSGTNVLRGGDGNDTVTFSYYSKNTIEGGAGNDLIKADYNQYGTASYANTFAGGTGNDRIQSGGSADTYLFNRGDGQDTINDNGNNYGGTSGADKVVFGADINANQVWLRHVGNNLEVSVIGTAETVTIENWYSSSAYHIEQLKSGDGKVLLDSQVENLVQAMAAFAPPAAGQTTLPQNYQDALAPVIAANWQ